MDTAQRSSNDERADELASSNVYYIQEHRRAEIMIGVTIESDQESVSDDDEPLDARAQMFIGFRGGIDELKVKNIIDLHRQSLLRRARPHTLRSSAIDIPDMEITCRSYH